MKIGTIVKCMKTVQFTDGTQHLKDSVHIITAKNLSYFENQQNSSHYFVVSETFAKADELMALWNKVEEKILMIRAIIFEWNDFKIDRVGGKMRLIYKDRPIRECKLIERIEATKYIKDFMFAVEADLEGFQDQLDYSIVTLKEILK